MTSEPRAPGASAIILTYEQVDDPNTGESKTHERIKVLTTAGTSAANIQIPGSFIDLDYAKAAFSARVIQPSGTTTEFVMDKTNAHIDRRGIVNVALPNAAVGSILEYFVNETYNPTRLLFSDSSYAFLKRLYEPYWPLQQKYFIRSEHFDMRWPDDVPDESVHWTSSLPKGVEPHHIKSHIVLDTKDVPGVPQEVLMPPLRTIIYKVDFYFYGTTTDYWSKTGADVGDDIKSSTSPGRDTRAFVQQLMQPTDSDEMKLRRIYDVVQSMENTDFSRERSKVEEKKNGEKTGTHSDDVLQRKRGTPWELTSLFLAMAKAAGVDAFPLYLSSRDYNNFDSQRLSWSQFDAQIVYVPLKEGAYLLDPGTAFCPFGLLAPNHSFSTGLVLQGKKIFSYSTPSDAPKLHPDIAALDLKLEADGEVKGTLQTLTADLSAMAVRQRALRLGEDSIRTELEKAEQAKLPEGMALRLVSLKDLNDRTKPIITTFEVSGRLGTATSKRLILPVFPLESRAEPLLPNIPRAAPVWFPTSYARREITRFQLPAGFAVESLPKPVHLRLGGGIGEYAVTPSEGKSGATSLLFTRAILLNELDIPRDSYEGVRGYYEAVNSADHGIVSLVREAPSK